MPLTPAPSRPKVGVAAIIHNTAGAILMGERSGAHGAGTLQCPGGHMEYGETFAGTAAREAREETGLEVGGGRVVGVTSDVFGVEGEGGHYVTVFVACVVTGVERVARAMEPHKCAKWEWVPWSQMWAWAGEQAAAEKAGREVGRKLFLPLVNLWREYPELETYFVSTEEEKQSLSQM